MNEWIIEWLTEWITCYECIFDVIYYTKENVEKRRREKRRNKLILLLQAKPAYKVREWMSEVGVAISAICSNRTMTCNKFAKQEIGYLLNDGVNKVSFSAVFHSQ